MNQLDGFKPCIIIPVYNHEKPLPGVITKLKKYDIPCLLIDDGSQQTCASVIQNIADQESWVSVISHSNNCGKGAAIKSAIRFCQSKGYTHALQIDADAQHDLGDVPRFLDHAKLHPNHVVIGQPIFDESVPKSRYYSRYLTHIWVWINTLSFQLQDTMCGFRVYPVAIVADFIDQTPTGNRMEFDIEILVKLFRQQTPIDSIATKVKYPEDGLSHFRLWKDNVLISRMHAGLFYSLITRYIPQLINQQLVK